MRKVLPIIILSALFLTPLYPIYAQNSATAPAMLRGDSMERPADKKEDKMASRSAQFQSKLDKFKDKAKAKRVENINKNLNKINERRTSNMQNSLDKIAEILENLKAKVENAAASGKNVTKAENEIELAQSEWEKAELAVQTQSEKDYTISVISEETVGESAKEARESLRADLKSVHTLVVNSRKALADALGTALNIVRGGQNGSE